MTVYKLAAVKASCLAPWKKVTPQNARVCIRLFHERVGDLQLFTQASYSWRLQRATINMEAKLKTKAWRALLQLHILNRHNHASFSTTTERPK
jgi:hypothetical protein